jgi:hypothetical protein
MQKFEIIFYNRFACQDQLFYVIARDEEHARELFWIAHSKICYGEHCIERIGEYSEPYFYTEQVLLEARREKLLD